MAEAAEDVIKLSVELGFASWPGDVGLEYREALTRLQACVSDVRRTEMGLPVRSREEESIILRLANLTKADVTQALYNAGYLDTDPLEALLSIELNRTSDGRPQAVCLCRFRQDGSFPEDDNREHPLYVTKDPTCDRLLAEY